MSSSSANSRSGARVVLVVVAIAVLLGGAGATGLILLGSTSSSTLASRAEPGEGEISELFTTTTGPAEAAPSETDRDAEAASRGDLEGSPSADEVEGSSSESATNAPIDEVYAALSGIASKHLGAAEPQAAFDALTSHVGPIPAPADATVANFGLDIEEEERDGERRYQYRASMTFYTQDSPDAVLGFYRAETGPLGLPEREIETDSDDDGPYTDVDFGDFGSHPDPLIWWANLSLRIRSTDTGTSVRVFYTVTRTDAAVPSGLATDLAAALPLPDGYQWTTLSFSALTIDPFTQPIAFSHRLAATAASDTIAGSEAAELSRLADAATESGAWVLDEQTGDGVWLDRSAGPDVRSYVTVRLTDDRTVVSYSFS